MDEYRYKYQPLSEIVRDLPESVPVLQYLKAYLRAVAGGEVEAVPIGGTFRGSSRTFKDDLVRRDKKFEGWSNRTVKALELRKVRRGVVADAEEVISGTVDFDELAAQYRQQLKRVNVKRPQQRRAKGKPKLTPTNAADELAAQPAVSGAKDQ